MLITFLYCNSAFYFHHPLGQMNSKVFRSSNQRLTMKIPSSRRSRSAAILLTAGTATALTTNRHVATRSFMGAALANNRQPLARTSTTSSRSAAASAGGLNTGGMSMLFEKFFGGGAYNTRIDYESLSHPGPELATLAQTKQVTTHSPSNPNLQLATFAGGCFWGLELAYQRVPGVVTTAVGYAQSSSPDDDFPTYDQVCAGNTGHTEAVMVYYDPLKVTYEELLDTFFGRVNPTTKDGQGRDYGKQYRTGVYYHGPEQEAVARKRFEQEAAAITGVVIHTECKAATPFWPAEQYHQQYLEKGGRSGRPQSADKGITDDIRCYG